ncbi:DUF5941 domain-containing protein [Actinomadura rupiterrae]|uniref:DUF5941 domain-containing protein n=1 Tax=Actinomadura rupiterrae TaxID=559627 RepID=UPI0020A49052|nr:DUF5941 domain-containing protein [Actinomadura rupiterrae]MCP2335373.1 hypothetical protein [Actinomadura rupiterrae]
MTTTSPAQAATAQDEAGDQASDPGTARIRAYRDDGPIGVGLGVLARGLLPPLPGALVALAVSSVLLATGLGHQHSMALFAPAVVLLLTGLAAGNGHTGRLDWLVPPIIRAIEYGYVAVLGFAQGVPAPLVFLLLGVLAFHHYDTVYRTRQGHWPAEWLLPAGLGWEGRMLLVAFFGLSGLLPFAYAALAAYLGVLFACESAVSWAHHARGGGGTSDLEEEGT